MKKILLTLSVLCILVGCKKDSDADFDAVVDANTIHFKPIPGGAVMSYNIPESKSIYGINITYTSATGKEMTVAGTYGAKELTIKGFIDAVTSVPAQVRYLSRENTSSEPTDVTFSTLDAGAVSVFDNMKVEPFWGGFSVKFEAPENVDGLINIGYMGISPTTGKRSVILKETRLITPGKNNLRYNNIVNKEENIEAVVWTEDIYQNEAKRVEFDVMPKMTRMVDPSLLSYDGNSYEWTYNKLSKIYLFDGDNRGTQSFNARKGTFAFATESDVSLKPEGIIDLQEPQVLAYFRMYAPLNNNISASITVAAMDKSFANHFKLFASNDKNAVPEEWIELAEYYQSNTLNESYWWCYPQFDPAKEFKNLETLESADPCYVDVNFDVLETKYRYLKIQFIDVFYSRASPRRAYCSEMEVFVEK